MCVCVCCRAGERPSAPITSLTCPTKTTRATRPSLSSRATASSVNQPSSQRMGGASGWPSPPSPSASQTRSSVRPAVVKLQHLDQQLLVNVSDSVSSSSPGASVDSVLNGIEAKPELFPESAKDVPDINFFYRSRKTQTQRVSVLSLLFLLSFVLTVCFFLSFRLNQATASCDQGRSSVVSVRCNPEKSERGELSVPR